MQKGPERDFAGYGRDVPNVNWPGEARIALQFVINYEEGSEHSILDGDPRAETSLAEVPGGRTASGERDLAMESMYEYGSRVGVWRLFRIFAQRELPVTIFACAQALERNPEVAKEIVGAGYDICCHGLRWVEHFRMSEAVERAQIREAVQSIARADRHEATRLVLPLRTRPEHAPPPGGGRRLPLRQRCLQRRPALLGRSCGTGRTSSSPMPWIRTT